ncbi:MAG TPA: O-antigen ligase family protein [Terriglobales bacterium]|nr:O-antigen ligase family protein [Terriglobales bacterium]
MTTAVISKSAAPPNAALAWVVAALTSAAVLLAVNMAAGAVALGLVLVFLAAFLRFAPLLYLMIFLIPLAPMTEISGIFIHDFASLSRIIFFAGVFASRLMRDEPIISWLTKGKLEKWGLALVAVAVFSAAVAHPLEPGSERSLFRLVSYMLFYYSITGWISSADQLRKCLIALFLFAIAVCGFAFAQIAVNGLGGWFFRLYYNQVDVAPQWVGRVTSVFLGVNSLSAHLNIIIPLALAIFACGNSPKRLRTLAAVCASLSVIVLVLTLSRGAFLAFFVMIAILLRTVLRAKVVRRKALALIAASAVAGCALSYYAIQAAEGDSGRSPMDRFTSVDEGTVLRGLIYAAAWNMFTASPLTGIGYGNFRARFNSHTGDGPEDRWDVHSLYFKYLAETGIPGLLVFLGLIVSAIRLARQIWIQGSGGFEPLIAVAVLAEISTVMVQGTVEPLIENPEFGGLLWFIFAVLAIVRDLPPSQPERGISAKALAAGAEA